MKRLILAAAALTAVAGPLAISTSAAAQGRGEWREDRREYRQDRRDDRREWRQDRRDDRRDWRQDRRDDRYDRRDSRWDNNRYNGYYLGNRWHYGQPQVNYYSRYDYRPGYRAWQRGQYLPPAYRSYVVNDYYRYRLRPPPRGYHWVRQNNDYILAAIATGLILEVISNNW